MIFFTAAQTCTEHSGVYYVGEKAKLFNIIRGIWFQRLRFTQKSHRIFRFNISYCSFYSNKKHRNITECDKYPHCTVIACGNTLGQHLHNRYKLCTDTCTPHGHHLY